MALSLLKEGFAILRVNLRGADPGRDFAAGSYSAKCNSDLLPVIAKAQELCLLFGMHEVNKGIALPLFGVGISLGGTILLN